MVSICMEGFSSFPYQLQTSQLIIGLVLALIVPLAFYVLRSIGLYVLAKKREFKFAFMAFIPLVWVYVLCRLVGEVKFFGSTIGKLAILLTILMSVSQLITLAYNFFVYYYPLAGNYLLGRDILITDNIEFAKSSGFMEFWAGDQIIWVNQSTFVYPYADVYNTIKILNIVSYCSIVLDIIYIVAEVTLFLNLFKKYWPQHFIMAFILSVFFGLEGPFVFAIRKKEPVDFSDYLRSRYQSYGNPYGYYGNPYGPRQNQNPNSQNQNYGARPNAPFEDYQNTRSSAPEEPFEEYNHKDNK